MFRAVVIYSLFGLLVGCAKPVEKKADTSEGFKLVSVKKGSIYERLGLKKGDILTEYNGRTIKSEKDATGFYEALKSQDKIKILLKREGKVKVIKAQLQP